MLRVALVLLAIAIVAPLVGYSFIADYTFESAKLTFYFFVFLAIVLFVVDSFRGRATA